MHGSVNRRQRRSSLVWHSARSKRTQVIPVLPVLRESGPLTMPVRLALINARRLNNFGVIEPTGNELNTYGQAVMAKAARHADGGQSADIADATDGIGKTELLIKIGVNARRGHGQRRRSQHVYLGENFFHLLLQNGADALGQDEVRGADFFIHIAANFAQRIIEFSHAAGMNEIAKRRSAFYGNDKACGNFPWTIR